MNIVLYCSVCGHALTIESKGSNSVCEYAYIVPCEVCATQQSVQPTIATAALEDSPFETGIRRNAVILSNRNSG